MAVKKTKTKPKKSLKPTQAIVPEVVEKKTLGRPTGYDPKYCALLIEHMASGLSFESFGATIGASRDRVYVWAQKHEDFAEAKRVSLDYNLLFWEKAGRDGLFGTKETSFNSTIWVFNMKNRHGWRDKQEIEMETNVKSLSLRADLQNKSTEELLQIMEKVNKKDEV